MAGYFVLRERIKIRIDSLPEDDLTRPSRKNDMFGKHEVKDILMYLGIRWVTNVLHNNPLWLL